MRHLRTVIFVGLALLGSLVMAGAQGWVSKYSNGQDAATAVKVDSGGNTIVAGQRGTTALLLKYTTTGTLAWATTYTGSGADDVVKGLALDSSDNIYLLVTSQRSNKDILILKYNASGVVQWRKTYNGSGDGDDFARAITVDSGGNVFVTGVAFRNDNDIVAMKYDTNGNLVWAQAYGNSANGADNATGIALDSSNNVLVCGTVYRGVANSDDFATIKFANADGAIQWVSFYNGTDSGGDFAQRVVVDSSDNVIVTGNSGTITGDDYVTVKYNSSGVAQWARRYNGPVDGNDYPTALWVSADGSIVVTGASQGGATDYDWATIKYDASGVVQWVKRTRTAGADVPQGIFVDTSYNVYVTGLVTGDTSGGSTGQDAFTVRYNASGTPTFSARYNGTSNNADGGTAITVFGGNIYVTMISYNGVASDIITIKYVP